MPTDEESVRILKRRYANGEISKKGFLEMKEQLKEDDTEARPERRTRRLKPLGIAIISILNLLGGLVIFIVGIGIFLKLANVPLTKVVTDEILMSMAMMVTGLVAIVAGYGIWKGKKWSWWLEIILAVMGIISSLLMTIIAVIALYYLTRPKAKKWFRETMLISPSKGKRPNMLIDSPFVGIPKGKKSRSWYSNPILVIIVIAVIIVFLFIALAAFNSYSYNQQQQHLAQQQSQAIQNCEQELYQACVSGSDMGCGTPQSYSYICGLG